MKKIFLSFFVCGVTGLCAQTLPSVVDFKTPEVAAFNKNVETPVSMYTGIPSISIPLYEITIKGVSVPITLDYSAGGIRVDEEATWVGLGWSLNYGGNISRKVRGAPDEKYYLNGANVNGLSIANYLQLPHINVDEYLVSRGDYLRQAKYGALDYMPDEFFYAGQGYSGKFMFNQQQNRFICFPKEDISIQQFATPANQGGSPKPFYSWNLKLPNGTSILYGEDGFTSQLYSPTVSDNTNNSWSIKKITNCNNESIDYSYTQFNSTVYKFGGQSVSIPVNDVLNFKNIVSPSYYSDSRINTISFPGGTIHFYTIDRFDAPSKALSQIVVIDTRGNTIKKINFYYDYFVGSEFDKSSIMELPNSYPDGFKYKRLKLVNVDVVGNIGQVKRYSLDYYDNNNQLPSKFTFSQDHYGFYNGVANIGNHSFIPKIGFELGTEGGDRRVNPELSKTFSIKSITYPEGGKTEFIYENNTAGIWDIPTWLLSGYQDDNLENKSAAINISSYSRTTSYPNPDNVIGSTRYFKKQFSLGANSLIYLGGFNFQFSTDFGTTVAEQVMPYFANNVEVKLEKINNNNSRTLVHEFTTTNPSISSAPFLRNGIDNTSIPIGGNFGAGNYELTVTLLYLDSDPNSVLNNQPYNLSCIINWREIDLTKKTIYTGGLRVKDINYYNENSNLVLKKNYSYINKYADPNSINFTSGRVLSIPDYIQNQFQIKDANGVARYLTSVSSYSHHPLETQQGSSTGYEYVIEANVDISNPANVQKTEYNFSFLPMYFIYNTSYMHLQELNNPSWAYGRIKSKKMYSGNNILQQEDYTYYDWSPHLQNSNLEDYVEEINTDVVSFQYLQRITGNVYPPDFYDIDIFSSSGPYSNCKKWDYGADDYSAAVLPLNSAFNQYCPSDVKVPYFKTFTGFDKPKSKTITTYDENGHQSVQVENYFYDKTPDLYQITRSETINSKGQTISSRIKYPLDFATIAPYNTMLTRHILNSTVENTIYNNTNLIQKTKTNYHEWGNNIIAPQTIESSLGNNPLELKMNFYQYDDKGNPLSASKANDQKVGFLWDYNKMYPVAEVANTGQDARFAYTSFEEGALGNWNYSGTLTVDNSAPTGRNSYLLNGTSSTDLNFGSLNEQLVYVVSYWTKNNSSFAIGGTQNIIQGRTIAGWTYFEHLVTNKSIVTISGVGYIDELKLYPEKALIKTYTYDPLIGITSQCDINNRITYYEYDYLNRLSLIRDQDKNILKKICYNYAGQQEDCAINNTSPQWVLINENRCKPCEEDNSYPSNIREHKEKDINPQSSTYNTFRWVAEGAGSCLSPANWINGYTYCQQSETTNEYTGFQVINQTDINPCSNTYNQPRQIVVQNSTACPTCSTPCQGPQYKCIGGQCVAGEWTVVKIKKDTRTSWICYYAYCFPDGTVSNYHVTVSSSSACVITCL